MNSPSNRPRLSRRILKWTLIVLPTAFVVLYLAISIVTADILTRPNNRPANLSPLAVSTDATAWSVRTSDGLMLRGWYLPTAEKRQLIALVHGMGDSWPQMAALGGDLHFLGYDVLLFDLRGHGQSDPSRLYMGRRERADIRAVLAWAAGAGFTHDRIGWVGYSMGASTLLMEAAQNPKIQVAVLDSPYGSLPELFETQLPKHSHLPGWFNPGILAAARYAYGVRTDDLIPIKSAKSWGQRPLLLIHGEADSVVPVSQARRIAQVVGTTCQTVTLPGVEHVQAYNNDPARYIAAVDQFFAKNLQP